VSGLSLPPAQPPAEPIVTLLDRIRTAREHREDAERQEHMLDQAIADHAELPAASLDYFALERRVARNRTLLWIRHLRKLEAMARARGLQP